MRRHSSYNYGFNNPIRFTDPDGMGPQDWVQIPIGNGDHKYVWDGSISSDAQAKKQYGKDAVDVTANGKNYTYGPAGNQATLYADGGFDHKMLAMQAHNNFLAPEYTPAGLGMGINLPGLNMAEGVGIVTANLAVGALGAIESTVANVAAEESSVFSNIGDKILNQMSRRGWTTDLIHEVVNNPSAIGTTINRATGNVATAFFEEAGGYVVKDNVTNSVIQISSRLDPHWIIDPLIHIP